MGFFSGTEYTAALTTVHVVEDIPDLIPTVVLNAILADESIANRLVAASMLGFHTKAEKYYKYGKKFDDENALEPDPNKNKGYIQGLPTAYFLDFKIDIAKATEFLRKRGINAKLINRPFVGPLSIQTQAVMYIQDKYPTWDYMRNRFHAMAIAGPHKIVTITIVPRYDVNGVLDPDGGKIRIYAIIAMETGTGEHGLEFLIDNTATGNYVIFTYADIDNSDKVKVYATSLTSSVSNELGIVGYEGILREDFYPICVLRENKVFVTDDLFRSSRGTKSIYQDKQLESTERLLDKLGIELDDIIDGISGDGITEKDFVDDPKDGSAADQAAKAKRKATKSLRTLESVFFFFAADVYSDESDTLSYLYSFFEAFYYRGSNTRDDHTTPASMAFRDNGVAANSTWYEFKGKYNQEVSWSYMVKSTGPLSKIYDDFEGKAIVPIQIKNNNDAVSFTFKGKVQSRYDTTPGFNPDGEPDPVFEDSWDYRERIKYYDGELVLRRKKKKLFATDPDLYEQLIIGGLWNTTSINADVTRTVETGLFGAYGEADFTGMFIPVSRSILRDHKNLDEAIIMYDSAQLLLYTMHERELAWYETFIFKVIIIIILVVITVYTGYGLVLLDAFLTNPVQFLLVMGATSYISGLILKEVDGWLGVILSVAVSIIGGNIITGGFNAALQLPSAMTAISGVNAVTGKALLSLAIQYGPSLTSAYFKSEAYALTGDIEEWEQTIKDMQEEIDNMESSLDSPNIFLEWDYDMLETPEVFAEAASEFFQRALNMNPGIIGYDQLKTSVNSNTLLHIPV